MDSTALAESVRTFVDEINGGDLGSVEQHIARDFYAYQPAPDEPTATQVWSELLSDIWSGLPDLHIVVDSLEPAGDGRLTGSLTVSGTHTEGLWGAPPSGARVAWRPEVSVRAVDGTFAVNFEGVATPDMIGILRQLGFVNPPDEMHLPPRNPYSIPPEFLLRVAFNGGVAPRPCSHLDSATVFDTDVTVCEKCVESGDEWPALRLCVTCGTVGCCDTSVNTHMKRHAEETGHVLMRSIRLTEGWMWCYADNAFFDSRTLARLRARQVAGDGHMVMQRFTTAIREAYAGRAAVVAGQHTQAAEVREWLESLEIPAALRAELVEPVRAIEDAFADLERAPDVYRPT